MAESVSPKALAQKLDTNPKALRRFMRSMADAATKAGADPRIPRVGQGNRYDMTAADARFVEQAWRKAHGMPSLPSQPKAQPKRTTKAKAQPQQEAPAAETNENEADA